ncbi:DUF397 domain-containing protein [Streptomyces sp. NBC_00038]|uniref:DUF397 domain-containing protein n=1 Tax=Streptomyces sp. NBC_00038 TaxID=2903615 RepID=UPI0022502947|nr:DUF397 domain-containing protein [Streptomyces sp. NBC_00038]MCX5559406.1 DUF397 domain-containing protein [Streptomyces sp. NBC_00038]
MNDELKWFKSSYSDGEGGACVEVAVAAPKMTVHVRDSKAPGNPELHIAVGAWSAFTSAVPTSPTTPSPK